MSSETKEKDAKGIDRRHFLLAGAAGAAGIAASSLGMNTASAKTIVPGEVLKTNATKGGKRVALINDALMQAIGSYEGGRMLFLGLGTGMGSAMIVDKLAQPMELAHLPYRMTL